jgi:hypothetical protein
VCQQCSLGTQDYPVPPLIHRANGSSLLDVWCANYVPTVLQRCANCVHSTIRCLLSYIEQMEALCWMSGAPTMCQQCSNGAPTVYTAQSGASSHTWSKWKLSVGCPVRQLCTNRAPTVCQWCATSEPTVCHRCAS